MNDQLFNDLRFGARMLVKHPGVTAIAVLTLALGIGANTAIFSVVNAVLLNPLPYRQPDRLVSLWATVPTHGRSRVAPANFFDWKKQNTVFEDVAAFGASSLTLTGDGEPEQLVGTRVSSGYFGVVGVDPFLGRAFLPEEHEPGKGQVVILGHAFWQRRYGGDKNIINRSITLDGAGYTVVGVMPAGIYPTGPRPAAASPSTKSSSNSGCRCRSRRSGRRCVRLTYSACWRVSNRASLPSRRRRR